MNHNFPNWIKRISLVLLSSIILVCSVPQFSTRSQAVAIPAIYNTVLYLSSYFATRGYSIIHDTANPTKFTSLRDWRNASVETLEDFNFNLAMRLNAYGSSHGSPGLGDEVIKAFARIASVGYLSLAYTYRKLLDQWIDEQTNNQGVLTVGTVTSNIHSLSQEAGYIFNYEYSEGSSIRSRSNSFDASCLPFYYHYSNYKRLYFLPDNLEDFSFNLTTGTFDFFPSFGFTGLTTYETTYEGNTYRVKMCDNISSLGFPAVDVVQNDADILYSYLSGAFDDIEVEGGSLNTNRITNTSDSEVLTSGNTISNTGEVEGDFILYGIDEDVLIDSIDRYNNNEITYDELLSILGLATVAASATTTEKEDALSSVAFPDSTYDWLTRTMWGSATVAETTDSISDSKAEEKSIADSVSDTLKGGNNSEDNNKKNRGKGLLAALLLGLGWWNTPIIAGDGSNPSDSGGVEDESSGGDSNPGYLADTIAGMGVAGNIVNSFFNAAGGSDGYGFIYTVGASFVIFSVVIGAANYFGALFHGSDTKQNSKPSAKASKPDAKPKKKGN